MRRQVSWGPGPRAAQALMLAARARALLNGRFRRRWTTSWLWRAPILRHRMALTFSARAERITAEAVIDRIMERVG